MLTLIIPIGPPGSGKSTLGNYFKSHLTVKYYYTSRDDEYKKLMEKHLSKNKVRRELFDNMIEFFSKVKNNKDKKKVVFMDSCNGRKEIRDKFIKYLNPEQLIFINYRFTDIDFLLKRTLERNDHPTFPKEEQKQKKTIINCLKSISYETIKKDNYFIIDLMEEEEQEEIIGLILNIIE
jgi:shikimate kinase